MDKIIVYTDGSSMGNGSQDSSCGWACELIYNGHCLVKSGGDIGKTNNQMEMCAVLNAMRSIRNKEIPVELYSDSQYVIETLKGNFTIKKNMELWEEIMEEAQRFKDIRFFWVKGHDKNIHNAEVDRRAVEESKRARQKAAKGE